MVTVIQKLQRDFPDRSIRYVTGVEQLGANGKVNNLCRLVREAKYDRYTFAEVAGNNEPERFFRWYRALWLELNRP